MGSKHQLKSWRAASASCALALIVAAGDLALTQSDDRGVGVADGFGRMFHLPPFAAPSNPVRAALLELGKRGGVMDAQDNLAAGPIELIVNQLLSGLRYVLPPRSAGQSTQRFERPPAIFRSRFR